MLPYKKNGSLKQYQNLIFKNILSSQFVYSTQQDITQLKRVRINIHTKKNKKIHYFYLWLLTGQIPYLRKFHSSTKKGSINPLLRTKAKNHSLQVAVQPKKNLFLLAEILTSIISKQIIFEKKVWTFWNQNVRIMIPFTPLTRSTIRLQAKNSYFPYIPLAFNLQFKKATAFQRLFFLRALRIINKESQIKNLDLNK